MLSEEQTYADALFEKLCLQMGYITLEQIVAAQDAATAGGSETLGDVLVSQGVITAEQKGEVEHYVRINTGENKSIAGFEIMERIGDGSFGGVFRAAPPGSGQMAVLKLMPPFLERNKVYVKQFEENVERYRRLRHPNLPEYVRAGFDEQSGLHFYAVEYIDGETLAGKLYRDKYLPEGEALGIIRQVAAGLQHAQHGGLTHGNIKPSNIVFAGDGRPVLLDMGLAVPLPPDDETMIVTGAFVGTPRYASPEQARQEQETGVRTDIYSLGAVFYHMVTGREPISGFTAQELLEKHNGTELPWPGSYNPRLSEHTCLIIEKMLARDDNNRYKTYLDLLADIDAVLGARPPTSHMLDEGQSTVGRRLTAPPEDRVSATTVQFPAVEEEEGEEDQSLLYVSGVGAAIVLLLVILGIIFWPSGEDTTSPDGTGGPAVAQKPPDFSAGEGGGGETSSPDEADTQPGDTGSSRDGTQDDTRTGFQDAPSQPASDDTHSDTQNDIQSDTPGPTPDTTTEQTQAGPRGDNEDDPQDIQDQPGGPAGEGDVQTPVKQPVQSSESRLVEARRAFHSVRSRVDKYGAYLIPGLREDLQRIGEKYSDTPFGPRAWELLSQLRPGLKPLKAWTVEGFPAPSAGDALKRSFAPEEVPFDPLQAFLVGTTEAEWQKWWAGEAGLVERFSRPGRIAYAHFKAVSPVNQEALVYLGIPSAVKIWVNGEFVYSSRKADPQEPGTQCAAVQMKSGDNSILVKVTGSGKGRAAELSFAAAEELSFATTEAMPVQTNETPQKQNLPEELLSSYDKLLAEGAYREAWTMMERAGRRPDLLQLRDRTRELRQVALSLLDRRRMVREVFESLKQQVVTLGTLKGDLNGRLLSVDEDGLTLLDGQDQAEQKKVLVKWQEITLFQDDGIAGKWQPEGVPGAIAAGYAAVQSGKAAEALEIAASHDDHPLSAFLKQRAEHLAVTAGAASTGFGEWTEIFNGEDLDDWQKEGKMSVKDGVIVAEGVSEALWSAEWSQFNLECEIRGETRYTTVGVLGFGLAHPGPAKPYAKVVNVLFLGDGTARVFVTGRTLWKSEPGVFPLGEWLKVRFDFSRSSLKIYREEELAGEVDLSEIPVEKGGLRIYSYMFGSVARFRNLRIQTPSE